MNQGRKVEILDTWKSAIINALNTIMPNFNALQPIFDNGKAIYYSTPNITKDSQSLRDNLDYKKQDIANTIPNCTNPIDTDC